MFPSDPHEPDGSEEIILDDEAAEEGGWMDLLEKDLEEGFDECTEVSLDPSIQTPPSQPPPPPPSPPSPPLNVSGDLEVSRLLTSVVSN